MKKNKGRNIFWNIVIVVAVLFCMAAFTLHYKNWTSLDKNVFSVYSGLYRQEVSLTHLQSMEWVKKLPQMERKNGFSWLAKEKGVFKDSITGIKVYVFVDDLKQQKLHLSYNDSLQLFFNMADSLETQGYYEQITIKMDSLKNIQNNDP